MEDHVADMTGIAFVTVLAVLMGMLFVRLRQPPIVGYILAGLVLGPTGLGFVTHAGNITLLAELGVIMLLFLVGMELSLKAFILVLRPAVLTALAQVSMSLVITLGFAALLHWPVQQAILLAFIVAVSSTAVAMRMLDEIGELRTETGRITVGVLIAQDIAIVPMLVLVNSFSGGEAGLGMVLIKLAATGAILFGVIRVLTRRGKIALPFTSAVTGKVDLIALACVAFCFGAAALTGLLGLSAAFGAFLAGLIVANSTLRAEAINVTEPIQSVLMVVFFLSIGLLIDLRFIVENLTLVVIFVLGVLVAKSAFNVAILHLVGEPWERAFPAGLIMAQIGEFSFVLAAVGIQNRLIDPAGYKLAIAVIAMSLLISPLWMVSVRRFHEVATRGITDFRAALAETYSGELQELERGADRVRRLGRSAKRRLIAARIAWRNARERRARTTKETEQKADGAADEAVTAKQGDAKAAAQRQ